MTHLRLDQHEIDDLHADWPVSLRSLARALRELILSQFPDLGETIAFGSLCYFKPGQPFGVIGGNVCMIGRRGIDDHIRLEFIHGAALPDPTCLLQGSAKAKRFIPVRKLEDIDRDALIALIDAAVEYEPRVE